MEQRTAVARNTLRTAPTRHAQFRNSNFGYVIVGAAIDRLAGSYEQALHDLAVDPLGINSAGFGSPPDIWGHQVIMSPHVLLPDGSGHPNPGISVGWHGEWAKGFPIIEGDDATVLERLVAEAASI